MWQMKLESCLQPRLLRLLCHLLGITVKQKENKLEIFHCSHLEIWHESSTCTCPGKSSSKPSWSTPTESVESSGKWIVIAVKQIHQKWIRRLTRLWDGCCHSSHSHPEHILLITDPPSTSINSFDLSSIIISNPLPIFETILKHFFI